METNKYLIMSEPEQTWDPAAKAGDLFLVIRWELGRREVATFWLVQYQQLSLYLGFSLVMMK